MENGKKIQLCLCNKINSSFEVAQNEHHSQSTLLWHKHKCVEQRTSRTARPI